MYSIIGDTDAARAKLYEIPMAFIGLGLGYKAAKLASTAFKIEEKAIATEAKTFNFDLQLFAKGSSKSVGKIPWGSWADYEKVTVTIDGKAQTYAKVGDRLYSKHAVDRMQPSGNRYGSRITQAGGDYGRSVAPEYIEQVIRDVKPVVQENGNLSYTSGSLQIITNKQGAVFTIITK